jgi:hypothetical protein
MAVLTVAAFVMASEMRCETKTERISFGALSSFVLLTEGLKSASLGKEALDLADGFSGVESLWTGLGTVHDGVTAVESERIFEGVEAALSGFVAAVLDPAPCLEEDGGPKVAVAIPPVGGARGGAAEAEDALPSAVDGCAFLGALSPFAVGRRRCVGLEPGLDGAVLGVSVGEIGDQVAYDRHVGERGEADRAFLRSVA